LQVKIESLICNKQCHFPFPYLLDDLRKEEYYPGFGVEHTAWINTVAAINDSYFLTGSNDTSIKLWSLKSLQNKGICSAVHSYMVHTDYVQKITVPRFNRDTFYSIALDKTVRKWDLNCGKADDLDPALIHLDVGTLYCGNNYSSYSLACDEKGHVVAFGSPEKVRVLVLTPLPSFLIISYDRLFVFSM
jgi:WD40 repeat protein